MAAKVDYAKAMSSAAQSIMMDKVHRKLSQMDPADRDKLIQKLNEEQAEKENLEEK